MIPPRLKSVLFTLLLLLTGPLAMTQDLDLNSDDLDTPLDALDDSLKLNLEEGPAVKDLSGLAQSCYLPLADWVGVRPAPNRKGETAAGDWRWAATRGGISPLNAQPIHTHVAVPAAGTYRIFLRQRLQPGKATPVTLQVHAVTDAAAAAEPQHRHVFGAQGLDGSMTGQEHERKRPLLVESEPERLGMVNGPMAVWEYVDLALEAGVYELRLSSPDTGVLANALLLTQARAFHPSLDKSPDYNTLSTIYLRYRIREAEGAPRHAVHASLTYHWRGRSLPGSSEPIWGWPIGSVAEVATGEWTDFIDASEAIVPGPGPWSTCNIAASGIRSGILEVELAWRPHPAAVMRRVETRIVSGQARIRVGHGLGLGVDGSQAPVWGVWHVASLERYVGEGDIVEDYFRWADAAVASLNLPADHPRAQHITFNASSRTTPAYNGRSSEMLARLGVNWVNGAPEAVVQQYGLKRMAFYGSSSDYERAHALYKDKPDLQVRVKVGDEIHTRMAAGAINHSAILLAGFHDFLRDQAAAAGLQMADFLGTAAVGQLRVIDELPPYPGIYERRLYYLSSRYAHLASAHDYRAITEGYHRLLPRVEVYNNYSPHPVFLTGATMNDIDWFVLCRNQAQSLGWGEDWATGGGWGLGTAYQCTSFYAALVACGTRRHGYPGGFYVGSNCGGSANKIFACLGQGLTRLHLYDWGPIDGWAEGSNSWSENEREYRSIAIATHAVGPADTIIGTGKRVPARVAIVYNRSHEIWQGGSGRMNHDAMWTYIASYASAEPVDVVLEDDIPDHLQDYQVLFLGGYNLGRDTAVALQEWVAAGHTLILSTGGGMLDLANDPNPVTTALAGVQQRPLDGQAKDAGPITVTATQIVPAGSFAAAGVRIALDPTDAQVVATWADGSPAATLRSVGQGRVLTLGFQPGFAYQSGGRADGPFRDWLCALLRATCGPPVAELDWHASEVTTFTHDSGVAVLLNAYGAHVTEPTRLTVRPDRAITQVHSALRGELPFTRDGDAVVITVPELKPVDIIILR